MKGVGSQNSHKIDHVVYEWSHELNTPLLFSKMMCFLHTKNLAFALFYIFVRLDNLLCYVWFNGDLLLNGTIRYVYSRNLL